MPIIFSVIVMTAVLSTLAVAATLWVSRNKAWYDQVNDRKIHSGDIPRLGGIGFAPVIIASTVAICIFNRNLDNSFRYLPCLGALVIALSFGVWDDFRPMSPRLKLLAQILAALCVVVPGYTFTRFFNTNTIFFNHLGQLGIPITLLWLIGIANAVNFIDGVDGLAGGISVLIALTLGAIFCFETETHTTVLFCAALAGAVLGFLAFNAPLPRAKIFMGDGGSQFLGFALAIIPLLNKGETPADLPLVNTAALFAIPILDTTSATWRRLREGKRIDNPDRAHIHHKLMNLGFSARGVDTILYSLQIVLGILVFASVQIQGAPSICILGTAYLVPITFFAAVHFLNRKAMAAAGTKFQPVTVKPHLSVTPLDKGQASA